MMKHFKLTMLGTVLAASLLSACGGNSDSPAATTTAATVSGTAATGAAIAGGTVSMNCVSGASATTTTAADGSYSMSVSGITFPCVARVSYGTANKLQTYVAAAGTANITPLTELILASLIGDTAANGFDKFDGAKAKLLTAAQVTAAIAAIKSYLGTTLGVAVTDFPVDPIGTKFVAKNGTTAGDKADAVLDALATYFKVSGKTLGDAVSAVAKSGGTSTGATSTGGSAAAGTPGTLTVTNASKASRNGSFAVVGDVFVNPDSKGFIGNTKDGLFETETSWNNSTNAVLKAAVWYFEASNSIIFFACDNGQNKPCSGVTFDGKNLTFNNTVLPETGGSTTVTVNGSIAVK